METGPSIRGPVSRVLCQSRRSEWQVVVLVLERARELLEVVRPCGGTGSGPGLGLGPSWPWRATLSRVAAFRRAKHDQLPDIDLGRVLGLPVLVLPLAILDAAFDVEFVALLHVTLHDVGQLRVLAVPHHAAVPLGLFLLVAAGVVPGTAGRERKIRNAVAARCRSH